MNTNIYPYRDLIVNGKEQMANRYGIVNIDYFRYQGRLTQKNMRVTNFLLMALKGPSNLLYTEDEIKQQDDWIRVFEAWREKFVRYGKGEQASTLM